MSKHCPECQGEFRQDLETCPDCGVRLVSGPAPNSEEPLDESVELVRTRDRLTLTRLLGMLDESDIGYQIGEGIVLSSIVGEIAQPVRVFVLESEADRAREILQAMEESELPDGAVPPDGITPQ